MKKAIVIYLCVCSVWADTKTDIVGGTAASAGEFSYAAAIYKETNDDVYFCSGTLITNQWILTSGYCVENATFFTIHLGSNSLSSIDKTVVRLAADEYFVHPDYNGFAGEIGLIKLSLPVSLTDYIQPVTVLTSALPEITGVLTFGWGQTTDDSAGSEDQLSYIQMTTLSVEECRRTFGDIVTDNVVCTNGSYYEGTCTGDPGSPLLVKWGGIPETYVVGISSFISSNGCESTDSQELYHI